MTDYVTSRSYDIEEEFDSNEMTKMLSYLRIVVFDDEDITILQNRKESYKTVEPLNIRNERAVIFKLITLCNEALYRYPRSLIGD